MSLVIIALMNCHGNCMVKYFRVLLKHEVNIPALTVYTLMYRPKCLYSYRITRSVYFFFQPAFTWEHITESSPHNHVLLFYCLCYGLGLHPTTIHEFISRLQMKFIVYLYVCDKKSGGRYKTWTLDSGLDNGLDYRLNFGLDFRTDSIMYELTLFFGTFQAFSPSNF